MERPIWRAVLIALVASVAVALSPATAEATQFCGVARDGTAPPPASLGDHSMRAFGPDRRQLGAAVDALTDPVGHQIPMYDSWTHNGLQHLRIGGEPSSWASWANGYTGDYYVDPPMWGSRSGAQVSFELPPGTKAFYFHLQAQFGGDVSISAAAGDVDGVQFGSVECGTDSDVKAMSFPRSDTDSRHARFYGVYLPPSQVATADIRWLHITTSGQRASGSTDAEGVAVGQFGISLGTPAVPGPEVDDAYFFGESNPAAPGLVRCDACDPVNTSIGNLYETVKDIEVLGRGGLLAQRTYNSMDAAPRPGRFGRGWSDSYGAQLTLSADQTRAIVRQGNGSVAEFERSDGTWKPRPFVDAKLRERSDGTFAFALKNHQSLIFSDNGQLIEVVDQNGYATSLSYEGGRLVKVTDAADRVLAYHYGDHGFVDSITDPAGRTVRFHYTSAGQLAEVVDVGGGITRYSYDAAGRLSEITNPRGAKTTTEYYSGGRVRKQTDAKGGTSTFQYGPDSTIVTDPRGVKTRYALTQDRQLESVTKDLDGPDEALWGYSYYKYGTDKGRLWRITDPNGVRTYQRWDPAGNPLFANNTGAPIRTVYRYTTGGDVASITDATGNTTSFEYDAYHNPTKMTRSLGGQTISRSYRYDPEQPGNLLAMTDERGNTWRFTYDQYGNRTEEIDPEGHKASRAYNELGWLMRTVDPRGHVDGANADDYATSFERDSFGNVTKVIDPLGRATGFEYDPSQNRTTLIDGAGHRWETTYDVFNQPVSIGRPDGTTTRRAYDALGNLVGLSDGLGHTTRFEYDNLSRITKETDPLGRETTYRRDLGGRLVGSTRPDGSKSELSYNTANQLAAIDYADPATPDVSFTYDGNGRRTSMTDGTGTSRFAYDELGRLSSSTDGAGRRVGYEYDPTGALTAIDYPDGAVGSGGSGFSGRVTRDYDRAGRITAITGFGPAGTVSFAYDPAGHPTRVTYPNGVVTERSYDRSGDLIGNVGRNDGSELFDIPSTRDALGRMTETTASTVPSTNGNGGLPLGSGATATQRLGYDSVGRLTETTMSAGQSNWSFEYDAANRLTQGTRGKDQLQLSYNEANEITKTSLNGSASDYSYDAAGQRTGITPATGSPTRYSYDAAGRLIKFDGRSGGSTPRVLEHRYDGEGLLANLTWMRAGGLPLAIGDGRNAWITGPDGLPLAQLKPDGAVQYFHADSLGSTRALTDSRGRVVARYAYEPYGAARIAGDGADNPFRFAGQYTDASGLVYMRARWYDPNTAQFLTRDPIGLAGGDTNVYGYVYGDPANLIDPEGLFGLPSLEDVSNFAAGFGDAATAPLGWVGLPTTMDVREWMGTNKYVDFCSGWYTAGEGAGIVTESALGGFGAARAARALGYEVRLERYRRGGGGINAYKKTPVGQKDKRLAGADLHPIPRNGGSSWRPHVDVPSRGIRHWPW